MVDEPRDNDSEGLEPTELPPYTTADLNANYALGTDWKIGVNISNVFDNEHYQMFGGSLIGRRALVYTTYSF